MTARAILMTTLLAACNSGEIPVELHELGALEYEMPADWQASTHAEAGRQIVEWTPNRNTAKESITLVYSEPLPAIAKAGPSVIARHLVDAQRALHGSFGAPTSLASKHGFVGARIAGTFTPRGQTRAFTREHAVVIVDDHVLHLVYTAPQATSHKGGLAAVLDSLQHKGA